MSDSSSDDGMQSANEDLQPEVPRWESIEGDLDSLLDLDEAERRVQLEEMAADDSVRADLLRRLLAEDTSSTASDVVRFAELFADSDDRADLRRVGAFEPLELIGEGGMGEVYRARRVDGGFDQIVALKLLRRGWVNDKTIDRFLQERQVLAGLQHPHIAQLVDGGLATDGRPYFALEFVEGAPITEACDAASMNLEERLALFDQVLEAVGYAHRKLVVHRDLKPANILISRSQGVKLLDFGIAKILDEAAGADVTMTAERVLTPAYAAPELIVGEPVTTATDIYGLGMVLYELLSGVRPFPARATGRVDFDELESDPPTMSSAIGHLEAAEARRVASLRRLGPNALARSLKGDLDAILAQALRREPEQRYSTAHALRMDLQRYRSGEPVTAAKGTWLYKTKKTWRRHWPAFVATGLVTASLAAGLWVSTVRTRAAQIAEAKSEAVNRFLTDELLGSADPTIGGADLTVRQVLEITERTIDGAFVDQPEVETAVRRTLGAVRLGLGDVEQARQQIESALEIAERGGPAPEEVGRLLLLAAEVELQSTDLAQALLVANQGQTLLSETRPRGHPDHARAAVIQAQVDLARADPLQAERRLRRALVELDEQQPGGRDVRLEGAFWLATAMSDQGRRVEASEILREILATQEEEFGSEHPRVADTLGRLGKILVRIEEPEEADEMVQRALGINRELFGDAHPRTLSSLYGVGYVLSIQLRYVEARDTIEPWLGYAREALRSGFPVGVDLHNLMASIQARTGDPERAEDLYRTALETCEQLFGAGHDRVMMIRRNFSNFLAHQGKTDEAIKLGREVRFHGLEAVGQTRPDAMYLAMTAWFLARAAAEEARDLEAALLLAQRAVELAEDSGYYPWVALSEVHYRRGELDEAIAAQAQALTRPDALHLAGEERYMVRLFGEKGELQAAEMFLREHLARRQAARDATDPLVGHTLSLLGRNLLTQNRHEEAEQVLRDSLALFELRPPPAKSPWHVPALSDLGMILEDRGEHQEADRLLERGFQELEGLDASQWNDERMLLLERRSLVAQRDGRPLEALEFEQLAREREGER